MHSAESELQEDVLKSDDVQAHARSLFSESHGLRRKVLQWMRERNRPDVVSTLIYALRYIGDFEGDDCFKWMLWQQAHPEIKPFIGFAKFQSDLFSRIDLNFTIFIYPDVKYGIRLEEIAWGGVIKDGILALANPDLVKASKADYLNDLEPVFGIEINDGVRAYPYRIMD